MPQQGGPRVVICPPAKRTHFVRLSLVLLLKWKESISQNVVKYLTWMPIRKTSMKALAEPGRPRYSSR